MRHILFTLKECPFGLLDDEAHIRNVLANAAQLSESTLLDISSHKFSPCGVTAVALLAESHISIHTYPEVLRFSIDCYSCKAFDQAPVIKLLKEYFGAVRYTSSMVERGVEQHSSVVPGTG